MNTLRRIVLLLILVPGSFLSAQNDNTTELPVLMTIPSSASLSLAGSDLRLTMVQGKGAEQIITPSTVGKIWINYSSVVEGNSTNSICVSLGTNNLPIEIAIKLKVGPDAGAGKGHLGKPTDPITLSTYPQTIITDIGTCFTGQGIDKGHPLTYSWTLLPNYDPDILTMADLNLEVGVIYTIISSE
jgi:hypothetical protein